MRNKFQHLTVQNKLQAMEKKMSKAAITKNKIYNKLIGFSEQDLDAIANFIDFMRHKKSLKQKK